SRRDVREMSHSIRSADKSAIRRADKSAPCDGTGMGEKGYPRAHNEPARHANFDVHGLGEGRHQEEHNEEQAIGYGRDDSPDRVCVICRSAERRPTRRRDAIPRRPATSDGRSRRLAWRRRDEHAVPRQGKGFSQEERNKSSTKPNPQGSAQEQRGPQNQRGAQEQRGKEEQRGAQNQRGTEQRGAQDNDRAGTQERTQER